jgi:hypothetical protein
MHHSRNTCEEAWEKKKKAKKDRRPLCECPKAARTSGPLLISSIFII